MITPDAEALPGETSTGGAHEQCVPLSALAMDGTAPGVGDAVEYNVRGTIARVEGDKAYVAPESVNDEPMPAGAAAEPDSDDELMQAAMQADREAEG